MKLLVLNRSRNDYAKRRFEEESKKLGIPTKVVNYSSIHIKLSNSGLEAYFDGDDEILNYDTVVLRSPGLTNRFTWQERVLVDWLVANDVRVLNSQSVLEFPGDFDKLIQNYVFYLEKIPFIPTHNVGSPANYHDNKKLPGYPFILKRVMGSLGRDFKFVNSGKDLEEFVAYHSAFEFIAQPYLPTREDFRIIVLGNEVLGAMKRSVAEKGKPTNAAAGGKVEKAELTPELAELARKSAKVMKCEFCGVDVMYDSDKNPYVLEVNRYSVFKEFEHVTKVNVTSKIIEYLAN